MKCAILGTGSWGTALAQVLSDNGNDVKMYGISSEEVDDINCRHHNSKYFDCEINENIKAYSDMNCIHDAEMILFAVPTAAIESTAVKASAMIDHPVLIVNVAKGLHPVTHQRLSEVLEQNIPADKRRGIVSLIGPSHAEEVILRLLTAINAVCKDESAAAEIQELFSNSYFRVYRNTDVIGAEYGVAVKNIMAIASGILEGIGQGDNARAALMTRGLAEMARFGSAMGGKSETYLGLDGVGDLIVTCTSQHSRNFMAGYAIGKSGDAAGFLKSNTKTVEGIFACKAVYLEAQKRNISMPITTEMYRVLYENETPADAIQRLMSRDLKSETN